MLKKVIAPIFSAALLFASVVGAGAQGMSGSMSMGSMEHGMPAGRKGGDGSDYTGAPDLQAAISLVTAGGAPGHFSLVKALTALAGASTANAEVAKLTKQYGSAKVGSFVAVQNFAVNDAVKKALAAGVKFPKPMLTGKALAVRVVKLGVQGGTYYEGVQLDHLVVAPHRAVEEDRRGALEPRFQIVGDMGAGSQKIEMLAARFVGDPVHRCRRKPRLNEGKGCLLGSSG